MPLVERIERIINNARHDLSLAPIQQDREKSGRTLRLAIEQNGMTPRGLEEVARFMFAPGCQQLNFNIETLSCIHLWRKPWKNGKLAIIGKWEQYRLAIREGLPPPPVDDYQKRGETNNIVFGGCR